MVLSLVGILGVVIGWLLCDGWKHLTGQLPRCRECDGWGHEEGCEGCGRTSKHWMMWRL